MRSVTARLALAAVGAGALASVGSCGLASRDPASLPIPSDGVSGFSASAPVELCLGTARVTAAASATGAGAVCVLGGATAATCSAEDECVGIEQCICGRCIVRACQSSCGDGQVCRGKRCTTPCGSDSACDPGERCVAGGCARSCSADASCHFGERCDTLDDVCVAVLCGPSITCGAGDVCEGLEVTGEIREPELSSIGGEELAFVEIRQASGARAIYRARIDAPTRWVADPVVPVLGGGGEGSLGAPSVVAGATVELYFTDDATTSIGRAVSSDGGRTFVRDAEPALEASASWEAGRVSSPAAFEHRGQRYLAYEGGERAGVGIARLTPEGATRVGGGPVVSATTLDDPLFWRSVSRVGAPYAIVVGGVVRLYVTARGAEASDALSGDASLPADLNDSIGLLTSTDLERWQRYPNGPVLARVVNLRAYLGEREPAVRLVPRAEGEPGSAEMVFVSSDAAGERVTGVARVGSD